MRAILENGKTFDEKLNEKGNKSISDTYLVFVSKRTQSSRTETPTPETPTPETAKPETPTPETAKPETPTPETTKANDINNNDETEKN